MSKQKFFSRSHWFAFWLSFLVVETVYICTLAPSVTLEDSGELVTAAAYLGVPHPPGYPFWTMINWLFIHLFPFGNIAWRAALCSSLFGALSSGVIALITAFLAEKFCGAPLIQKHFPQSISVGSLCFISGVVGGLSLGFLESLWYQSVISEVYSLSAFLFSLVLLFMLRWLYEPQRLLWGLLMFFIFGVALTTHQTLLLFSPTLLLLLAFVNRRLLSDLLPYVLMPACMICWCTQNKFAVIVTACLYLVYIVLMFERCGGSFGASRIVFLAVTLPLPAVVGYLAAEAINDVSSFSTLANLIPMKWALFLLIFVVWLQLLISFFGSWQLILHYGLTVLSAISIATRDEYAICVTVVLYAFFAGYLIFRRHQSSKPAFILFLVLSLILPVIGGAFALVCLNEFSFLPTVIVKVGFKWALILAVLVSLLQIPLALVGSDAFWRARPALSLILAGVLGLGVYGYMPLASSTNPPMNWSYTRTLSGFVHSVTRGQYDAIKEARTAKDLFKQIQYYYTNLVDNYTLPVALLAILALVGIFDCKETEKIYSFILLVGWSFLSLVLTYLLNTSFEEQTLFINRVFYSTSHEIFSIWVGLGIVILIVLVNQIRTIASWLMAFVFILVLALLAVGFGSSYYVFPSMMTGVLGFVIFLWCCLRFRVMRYGVFPILFFLPVEIAVNNALPIVRSWTPSQADHDFGWMFGYDMLKDLDRDAILFGGTDQGRFVPTYMIFVESFAKPSQRFFRGRDFDRRDLYIITQNALADSTYMDYIRDHYSKGRPASYNFFERWLGRDKMYPKEPLKIPDVNRYNAIFEEVTKQLSNQPGSGVTIVEKDGEQRVGAEGLNAIFAINGGITKEIFEANKDKHTFYVEESFPISWMYPYLEPCGLIMKLNKNPIPKIPEKLVKQDMDYWTHYTQKLLSNPKYDEDIVARRAFSKLRSSIGGLYAFRGLNREAEIALLQSIALFPGCAESCSRLIELYVKEERFDEARIIALTWLENDSENKSVAETVRNLSLMAQWAANQLPLTLKFEKNPADVSVFLDLCATLMPLHRWDESDRVVSRYLNTSNPDSLALQRVVELYVGFKETERMEKLLKAEAKKHPKSYLIWYRLAAVCSMNLKGEEALSALSKAIQLNSNLKSYAVQDPAMDNIRTFTEFGKITGSPSSVEPAKRH